MLRDYRLSNSHGGISNSSKSNFQHDPTCLVLGVLLAVSKAQKTLRIKNLSSHEGDRQVCKNQRPNVTEVNQTWASQAALTSQFICTLSPFDTELGVA